MQAKRKRPSERLKRKLVARWRWLAARGVKVEAAALELGVAASDLLAWSGAQERDTALLVPVQVEDGPVVRSEIVVVLRSGVRIEGLTVADVAELARRLS